MEIRNGIKEIMIFFLAVIVLSISYIYPELQSFDRFLVILGGFILVIGCNLVVKKITAYSLEANVTTKFWDMYYFGFTNKSHFKNALPMIWLAPFLSFISRGILFWMPILEFEVTPRTERIAKRHELYRFADLTEWHIALIVFWGIVANLVLYVILNIFGLREIAVISLYYSIWSIVPLSSLDGSKLLFGSKQLWLTTAIVILLTFLWQATVF